MKPQNRINDPQTIDTDLIDKELKAGKDVLVQFSDKTYDEKKLAQLNEVCGKYDKDFEVRFYGHYSTSFDFNILRVLAVSPFLALCVAGTRRYHLQCCTKFFYPT